MSPFVSEPPGTQIKADPAPMPEPAWPGFAGLRAEAGDREIPVVAPELR
jgi:hypothetical protein